MDRITRPPAYNRQPTDFGVKTGGEFSVSVSESIISFTYIFKSKGIKLSP